LRFVLPRPLSYQRTTKTVRPLLRLSRSILMTLRAQPVGERQRGAAPGPDVVDSRHWRLPSLLHLRDQRFDVLRIEPDGGAEVDGRKLTPLHQSLHRSWMDVEADSGLVGSQQGKVVDVSLRARLARRRLPLLLAGVFRRFVVLSPLTFRRRRRRRLVLV
jgi:hypothetical protein